MNSSMDAFEEISGLGLSREMNSDAIGIIALAFDEAIMARNAQAALPLFHDECEIEMFGIRLEGREGAERWLRWMFNELETIEFIPLTTMVQDNILFEEFALIADSTGGGHLETKEAEVLTFKDEKIATLHLYIDRLEIGKRMAGRFTRFLANTIDRISTRGLEDLNSRH